MDSSALCAKLARLDATALASFLARLAEEDDALRERIEALALRQEPSAYQRALEARLRRFRDAHHFISYGESGAFAGELAAWLDDVETGLLSAHPEAAWKLVDSFIRSDEKIIGRADDSDGSIGDVFRRACGLWHRAAAALSADLAWVERVHELHAGNDYGTRDALLDEAATRLSELELRRLAGIYEGEARRAAQSKKKDQLHDLSAAAAMGQVARALGDAALYERSVRIHSPRPNWLQAEKIAEQYLRFGPAQRAVEWLTQPADGGRREAQRLDLLAQAYEKLGDRERLLDARRRIAESTLFADAFARYEALLPDDERPAARQKAIERAIQSREPVQGGQFLCELAEPGQAQSLVLQHRERLPSSFYGSLLDLAERLEKTAQTLGAIACYRALTEQILDEGRSKAYRHAKRYVERLERLHAALNEYGELAPHVEYLAELRSKHGRKRSFWALFSGS